MRTIPNNARTMPGRRPGQKVAKYGSKIERIDRRRECWSLRVAGCSYRQIGEKLGISATTAHEDCQIAEEQFGEIALQPEVVREGLMALHGKLNGALLQSLLQQMNEGQVVSELNANGEVMKAQRKNWPAPQIAAELGRNLQRMAGLAGLDTAPVDGGGQCNTTIVLSQPNDGMGFENRWENAAVHAESIEVSTASTSSLTTSVSPITASSTEPATSTTAATSSAPPEPTKAPPVPAAAQEEASGDSFVTN